MSNHDETILRTVGIFMVLFVFWFSIGAIIVGVVSLFDSSLFTFINMLYVFLGILFIRVFYPRFIFSQ